MSGKSAESLAAEERVRELREERDRAMGAKYDAADAYIDAREKLRQAVQRLLELTVEGRE